MTPEEQKLDRLYPKLAKGRRCVCCFSGLTEMHHIIGRRSHLLRWDIKNLVPLCRECHIKVHTKGIKYLKLFLPQARFDYLEKMKNKDFKQYLIEQGLTREDFYKMKEQQLNEAIK